MASAKHVMSIAAPAAVAQSIGGDGGDGNSNLNGRW
jgi:hypothetical protein